MKNKKMVITISVIILIIILGCLLFWKFADKEKETGDSIKFKEEYEKLNGTIRESDGASYNNVDIPSDNPIKYASIDEVITVLDSEEAIIYIGASWCPWCRNAVPVLFDVAKDYNIDTIYYLNMDEEKSTFEIQNGNLVKTKEGTSSYYKLLDKLNDILEDYVLTDSDGKEYNTGEKRIYMPFVIGVKNGTVVSSHTGTVTLDENQSKYDALTDVQYEELYGTYTSLLSSVFGDNNCNSESLCD